MIFLILPFDGASAALLIAAPLALMAEVKTGEPAMVPGASQMMPYERVERPENERRCGCRCDASISDWRISVRLTVRRRQIDQPTAPCGNATQEAVSTWHENPLWWRFESAQRERDKFHNIKGLG
ncbi:hypothetical protein [Bradyrhizobium cenepequi]|uniref:hypothetical protein n=1 Tax=Bradyrhizobium cenepequi TaxID=2821403 RepID=UPI001CE330F5|nr:hypothetical protein [Bradyrhizobium cenepequi]MCA6105718.1 hypothetical protein [Bradyrhizobium cenepequi]